MGFWVEILADISEISGQKDPGDGVAGACQVVGKSSDYVPVPCAPHPCVTCPDEFSIHRLAGFHPQSESCSPVGLLPCGIYQHRFDERNGEAALRYQRRRVEATQQREQISRVARAAA